MKVALVNQDRIVGRKKTKLLDISPVMMTSETFSFDVARERADQVAVVMSVMVVGEDEMGAVEEKMGQAVFDHSAPAWNSLLKHTRKPVIIRQPIL